MATQVKLNIAGMSCVNCANALQKVIQNIDGVKNVKVSFANASAEFEIDNEQIRKTIEQKIISLGYEVAVDFDDYEKKRDSHIKSLRRKFIVAFILSAMIMFAEMTLRPSWLLDFINLFMATIVLTYSGRDFFTHSYSSLKNRNFDMNVLVALGSSMAFFYSLAVFLFEDLFPSNLRHMYVSGSAMIITFILLGKYLEERSKAKTGNYLKSFFQMVPKTASIIKANGQHEEISASELKIGDIVEVKNGYCIPCDGVIIQGGAEIDTSMLTGESLPAYKKSGDSVFAGSINTNGYIMIQVQKQQKDTMLSQIITLLSDASTKKMPIARIVDKVTNIFVPSVIAISILTFISWMIFSGNITYAILSAISVLIISCPCALGLATPIAIIATLYRGAKDGILIKNPEIIENINSIKFAIFDKTGTLSKAQISVKECSLSDDNLALIASAEELSEHPISKSIVKYAKNKALRWKKFDGDFHNLVGLGIYAKNQDNQILVGNQALLKNHNISLNQKQKERFDMLSSNGDGVICCAVNGEVVGLLSIADEIKQDALSAIDSLKQLGLKVIMLTGDNNKVATHIARKLGIDEFYSNMLPDDKFQKISALQESAKVLFAGDGINDSPSLKKADVGVVMNSGADIAKSASDIVLIRNDVKSVVLSISLARNSIKTIKQNLFWAFAYNAICIPVAAGVLYPLFGILLNPVYGAMAMCFSSITVVLNSLRIKP